MYHTAHVFVLGPVHPPPHTHTHTHSSKNSAEWIIHIYMFYLLWFISSVYKPFRVILRSVEYMYIVYVYVCVGLNVLNEMSTLGNRSRKPSDCAVFWVVNFGMSCEFEFGLWLLWELPTSARWHNFLCWSQIGDVVVSLMFSLVDQGLRHSNQKFLIYHIYISYRTCNMFII